MLRQILFILGSVHVASQIFILLDQTFKRFVKNKPKTCPRIEGEDKISALPDELLVRILYHIPTKDAVATMILSKRWKFIWTMVPKLNYKETNHGKIVIGGLLGRLVDHLFGKSDKQIRFIHESLRLHKAPVLESLSIQLGPRCPYDVNVGKWVRNAIDRKVRVLGLNLMWSGEHTSLPKSLYRCNTLVKLGLYGKILVDVHSMTCLPSLKTLHLYSVVYKDEDSLLRLLSNCPILNTLWVVRHYKDNVKNFIIKVPSLELLLYNYVKLGGNYEGIGGSLVIDSPSLKKLFVADYSRDSYSIENKPHFDKAIINVDCYPDNKFMRSLSSVTYLELLLGVSTVVCCNLVNFSRLMECKINLEYGLDWLEPVMDLLQNSPNLKVLFIDQMRTRLEEDFSLSWNQPSHVPECLSAHLEIFEWKGYIGRSKEKELVKYVFANSKCLKRAGISIKSICKLRVKKKMMKELESICRVSISSQLLFSTQLEELNLPKEMND